MHAAEKAEHSVATGEMPARSFARRRALRDNTRNEAALQQELTRAMRSSALSELAAAIAHELSEPVTAVVADAGAGLRWLNSSEPDLHAVRESLEAIARDGRRAGDLLSRVRGLVERAPQQRTACDVSSIVQCVTPLLQRQLECSGIALDLLPASDLPEVLANPVELQQVVLCLLTNAVDAVSASAPERRRITVRSSAERRTDKTWVVVSVEDHGPGFAAADAAQLFTAFYSTKPGGLGLGLSICRSILMRHGGNVWAEPHSEQGATFRFALPARVLLSP